MLKLYLLFCPHIYSWHCQFNRNGPLAFNQVKTKTKWHNSGIWKWKAIIHFHYLSLLKKTIYRLADRATLYKTQSPTSVVLTDRKRIAQILRAKAKHWKKKFDFFFSINFIQIFRICPKMLQFLTYLLHKQMIEMRRSQNLRCPFSVPSQRLCTNNLSFIEILS